MFSNKAGSSGNNRDSNLNQSNGEQGSSHIDEATKRMFLLFAQHYQQEQAQSAASNPSLTPASSKPKAVASQVQVPALPSANSIATGSNNYSNNGIAPGSSDEFDLRIQKMLEQRQHALAKAAAAKSANTHAAAAQKAKAKAGATYIVSTQQIPTPQVPRPQSQSPQPMELIPGALISESMCTVNQLFPEIKLGDHPYSKTEIKQIISTTISQATGCKLNPFALRLPKLLLGCHSLFKFGVVKSRAECRDFDHKKHIDETYAAEIYITFLRQFNLGYIQLLKCINDDVSALTTLKNLINGEQLILTHADLYANHISNLINKDEFNQTMLAFIALNIIFSENEMISTEARIKTCQILLREFDVDKIGKLLSNNNTGLVMDVNETSDQLLPQRFLRTANTKMSPLAFYDNHKISEYFPQGCKTLDEFRAGLNRLVQKYPGETLQVLFSLLRVQGCNRSKNNTGNIFTALIKLCELESSTRSIVFGDRASYRNIGKESTIVDEVIGTKNNYNTSHTAADTADLTQLSRAELINRLRRKDFEVSALEGQLFEREMQCAELLRRRNDYDVLLQKLRDNNAQYAKASTYAQDQASHKNDDPQEYFEILGLRPDWANEPTFDEMLKRHYRMLMARHHPDTAASQDKSAASEKAKKINIANEILSDPAKRAQYIKQHTNRPTSATNYSRPKT